MKHHYRITIEAIAAPQEAPVAQADSLRFEISNHDELFAIVERMRQREDLDPDSATALAVGLKLFSEVMLNNRQHPLFAPLKEAFPAFMKQLKQGPRQES
jgi:hypothetical protein